MFPPKTPIFAISPHSVSGLTTTLALPFLSTSTTPSPPTEKYLPLYVLIARGSLSFSGPAITVALLPKAETEIILFPSLSKIARVSPSIASSDAEIPLRTKDKSMSVEVLASTWPKIVAVSPSSLRAKSERSRSLTPRDSNPLTIPRASRKSSRERPGSTSF